MIAILLSEFNKKITDGLLEGCMISLKENGYTDEQIDIHYVPGAFELPARIKLLKKSVKKYKCIITLGCIIKGETYHFEIIANETSRKIMDLSVENNKAIGFGILTCYDINQAIIRSDTKQKNKGREATLACIELIK